MVTRKGSGSAGSQAPFFVGRSRSRASAASSSAPAPRQPKPGTTVRLTGRGGIVVIVLVTFVAGLLAHLTGVRAISGGAFTTVCVLAALLVRPAELLSLSVSPPLAYFAGALLTEVLLALGSEGFVRSVAISMGSQLAHVAPWLFLGTALVLIITCFRGLPRNIRTLNDELNGRPQRRRS